MFYKRKLTMCGPAAQKDYRRNYCVSACKEQGVSCSQTSYTIRSPLKRSWVSSARYVLAWQDNVCWTRHAS